MDIQEIFENAKNDPSLFTSIDIDELLDNIENETTEYLENKTLVDISKMVLEVLTTEFESLGKEVVQKYYEKLAGYRYVEKVFELRQGIFIRWIRNKTLMNGGTVINIKIGDNVQIICKTALGKHISLRFDECIIFQKLTMEEQLILMSYDYLQNDS